MPPRPPDAQKKGSGGGAGFTEPTDTLAAMGRFPSSSSLVASSTLTPHESIEVFKTTGGRPKHETNAVDSIAKAGMGLLPRACMTYKAYIPT